MGLEAIFFYLFSAAAIVSGIFVIIARNPVHAVLFLILAFFSAAGLFVLLGAEFLAMLLVIVYVGAVAVLFLFVVMMLDIDVATMRAGFIKHLPVALLVAIAMVLEIWLVVGPGNFGLEQFAAPAARAADYNNTAELGSILYTVYMYPFEIAAVILLVAIIAAIGLTMRKHPETKYQNPSLQVRVRKGSDRVRLVKMEAED